VHRAISSRAAHSKVVIAASAPVRKRPTPEEAAAIREGLRPSYAPRHIRPRRGSKGKLRPSAPLSNGWPRSLGKVAKEKPPRVAGALGRNAEHVGATQCRATRWRRSRDDCVTRRAGAVMTLKVRLAKSPFVIHPMHEMPIGWAPLVGAMSRLATIPITTVTIFVTKITISTRFFDFHDRRVAPKNARWIRRCGSRRFYWKAAEQRKHRHRRC
jgi:hypothetical protein